MKDEKGPSKKSQRLRLKQPLLAASVDDKQEHTVIQEWSLNTSDDVIFQHSNEQLIRFLETIGLNFEELTTFVSDQGEDSEAFIRSLQQLFDHEKSCSSGFKWAALDHLVEKYLQWPFLSKSDLSGDSKCCTARVKPAQRSILLKNLSGLIKAYGVRGFVKGVEFTLSRTVRYFIYSMFTYRMVEWYQTRHLEIQEFRQIFDKNTEKGIDTLVRELSKVPPLYLNLILCSPLVIGGLYALNGMRGAKALRPEEIEKLTSDVREQLKPIALEKGNFILVPEPRIGLSEGFRFKRVTPEEIEDSAVPTITQSKSSKSCFKNTFQEFFPPFSWFSTTPQLQKIEKLIRWDGRISPEERLQLLNAVRQTAQESHQLTQLSAMECLAKVAHGIGLKDLYKLKEAGYSPEVLRSIVYTKSLALQTLLALRESNPDHPILALPRRLYTTYLLWWLGLSTSYPKQKIPFSVFKAAKTALEISFLYEITKSIVTAINCPDKPGYKFAEGFAEWASEYSLECFITALQVFRSIDPNESIEEFVKGIDQYHLTELKNLNLNNKNLNTTELYILLQAIVKRASRIEDLKIKEGNPFDTLIPGTFQGLSQVQHLDFSRSKLITLPAAAFEGLSQLQSLDFSTTALSTLSVGVFQGLGQLKNLYLYYTQLTMLSVGVFQGLNQLQSLYLNSVQLAILPAGVFQGLSQLQNLDLNCLGYLRASCRLSILAGAFEGLTQLQYLNLNATGLSTLPIGVFQGLSQLQRLDLRSNSLTALPEGVFEGLRQLQCLDLSLDLSLTTLSAGVFQGLSQLQNLSLSGSLITLPDEIFKGLNQLQSLSLLGGSFTTLPAGVFQGLSQLQSLDLSSTSLTTLPAGVFQGLNQLQSLDLIGSFTALPKGLFQGLRSLKYLYLGGAPTILAVGLFQGLNQLESLSLSGSFTTLPDELFQGLHQLQSLDLSWNWELTTLSARTFEGLTQLQSLNLARSPITNLLVGVFQSLRQLKNLHLGGSFTTFPADLFQNLSHLQNLYLDHNNYLTTLPIGLFQGLNQLQSLYLNDNMYLTTLPLGVFQGLDQLQSLDLYDTGLTTLSAGVFQGLSQLKRLSLSGTQLTTLPAGIFQGLSQLQSLGLAQNHQLTTLPAEVFQGLSQLKRLYLDDRQLTILPAGVFQGLSQLQSLNLWRSTSLTTLPAGVFQGLSQLQSLDLSSTSLTTLPAGVFQGLSRLQFLDLSYNYQLTTLMPGVFQGLSQLQSLDLRSTSLTTLPAGVFQGLSQLQYLDLSWSSLTILTAGVFHGVSQLQDLDLTVNKLTKLSAGVLQGLSQLKTLSLGHNQLDDTAIYNIIPGLPYSLQTLNVDLNNISDTGVAALVQLLPCSNISTFSFSSRLPLNDTALLLQQQRNTLERVCADRSCHANLPSKSCPPDSFYGRMHPKETSMQSSAFLYALPAPLTWIDVANPSLPTLSSCSKASSSVVMMTGGSALVVGSVGLGVLFYKNCTVLQSFVTTTQNFVIRCVYGKEQKPSADSIESPSSSTPAAALKTPPKKSSICNLFGAFFKPTQNSPPNLDVPMHSQQAIRL